jgi:hypothetical protein
MLANNRLLTNVSAAFENSVFTAYLESYNYFSEEMVFIFGKDGKMFSAEFIQLDTGNGEYAGFIRHRDNNKRRLFSFIATAETVAGFIKAFEGDLVLTCAA